MARLRNQPSHEEKGSTKSEGKGAIVVVEMNKPSKNIFYNHVLS